MIVVIEGISASGKSTWCAKHAAGHTVPENSGVIGAPDRETDPEDAAAFWVRLNAARWKAALAMERRTSLAVCDTDPLKLHYAWCLRQIGEVSERAWQSEVAATRAAVSKGEIGFADSYFVKSIEPDTARKQALADLSRRRRKFELHVRLQPPLLEWYGALAAVLPGRVNFGLPDQIIRQDSADRSPGTYTFDRLISALCD